MGGLSTSSQGSPWPGRQALASVLPGTLRSPTSSNCYSSGFLWSQPPTTLFSDCPPTPRPASTSLSCQTTQSAPQ